MSNPNLYEISVSLRNTEREIRAHITNAETAFDAIKACEDRDAVLEAATRGREALKAARQLLS